MTNARRVAQSLEDRMARYPGHLEFEEPNEVNGLVGVWINKDTRKVPFGVNHRAFLDMTETQISREIESTIAAELAATGPTLIAK